MEGLGRIVEEDGVSLAATRYDAACREHELTYRPHNAGAPRPEPLDCFAWVGNVLDVHCFLNRAWIALLSRATQIVRWPPKDGQPKLMVEQCVVAQNDWLAGRRRTDGPG